VLAESAKALELNIFMKNIAILIDCWYRVEQMIPFQCDAIMYKNIIRFIDNSNNIDSVCLSSFNCDDEYLNNNHWYNQIKNKEEKYIKYKNYNSSVFGNMKQARTSPLILNWKPNKNTTVAHTYTDLPNTIENVYLCGKAFDICVSKQPIGLYQWIKHTNVNVYVKQNCVLTSKGKVPNLQNNPFWEHVGDDFYKCIALDASIEPWENTLTI